MFDEWSSHGYISARELQQSSFSSDTPITSTRVSVLIIDVISIHSTLY